VEQFHLFFVREKVSETKVTDHQSSEVGINNLKEIVGSLSLGSFLELMLSLGEQLHTLLEFCESSVSQISLHWVSKELQLLFGITSKSLISIYPEFGHVGGHSVDDKSSLETGMGHVFVDWYEQFGVHACKF
jgi:hypothetical protein